MTDTEARIYCVACTYLYAALAAEYFIEEPALCEKAVPVNLPAGVGRPEYDDLLAWALNESTEHCQFMPIQHRELMMDEFTGRFICGIWESASLIHSKHSDIAVEDLALYLLYRSLAFILDLFTDIMQSAKVSSTMSQSHFENMRKLIIKLGEKLPSDIPTLLSFGSAESEIEVLADQYAMKSAGLWQGMIYATSATFLPPDH